MICNNCGANLQNGTMQCPNCGMNLGVQYQQMPYQQQPQVMPRQAKNLKSLYADQSEETLGVLGGAYLQNFLTMGILGKGFCALTDKRVYFKGKCFTKNGGHYKSTKEQRTLDVKDITGTGFFQIRLIAFLIIGILAEIAALIFALLSGSAGDVDGLMLALVVAIVGGVFLILFFFFRIKVFEIEYAGGKIAFPISAYNPQEIQKFQNALRLAKDNYVANQPQFAQSVSQPLPSSADEILKYKQLLDAGAISQEEFENAKTRLLQ